MVLISKAKGGEGTHRTNFKGSFIRQWPFYFSVHLGHEDKGFSKVYETLFELDPHICKDLPLPQSVGSSRHQFFRRSKAQMMEVTFFF